MRRRSRTILTATSAIAVSALLAGCTSGHHVMPRASASQVTAATADTLPSVRYTPPEGPVLGVPVAQDGVMESFGLDRDAFAVVKPPSWLHPTEPMSRVLVAMKEADPYAFSSPEFIKPIVGYGLVTIDRKYWRKPVYVNTPAWVVAYEDNRPSSCPNMGPQMAVPPKPSPPLPKHHYTVFVLPDAETWAVTFVERSRARCGGSVLPSTATLAESNTFVHWHVVSRSGAQVTVGYTIPFCGDDGMSTSGGNTKTNTGFIAIAESVPFGHPPNCSGTKPGTKTLQLPTATAKLSPPRSGPAIF